MDAVLASTIDILEDVVKLPDWQQELAFTEARHSEPIVGIQPIDGSWRLKERVKTVSVALVLCLNVGVDPPDLIKIEPAAHLECWFDPLSEEPQKAIEHISIQLEKQYEQWHSRARYKKCLDPTVDEVKRLCSSLRRYSKEDRVLFHYNGHGVPRPTQNGEIWVFNEKYTQYIPLAIYDLQQWMGAPSIYVFDCSCAGSIVDSFLEFAKQHKKDYEIELNQYNAFQQKQRQTVIDNNSATTITTKTNSDQQQKQQFRTSNNQQQQQDNDLQQTNNSQHGLSNQRDNSTNINASNTAYIVNSQTVEPPQTTTGMGAATTTTAATLTSASNTYNNNNSINNNTTQPPNTTAQARIPPIKPPNYENCFHLAACEAHQILPMQPDLPADLFTSCLTTPIKMALRWFIQKNDSRLIPRVTLDLVDKIPGTLNDRRTMLGELNWIFTAITDTIAWDVLPRELFQRLYRQDLLVASLFRNFLLADRIMRTYDCTPVSYPRLPKTYHHPMWRAWDMVVDLCLSQLVDVLDDKVPFKTSTFFAEQLTAFEVWLDMDHSSSSSSNENQKPDHQLLPIILQVLLSPVHRLRALDLLSRFLNLGPGAVDSALSVGIFPYVLKLLQSNAREVRPFLLSIWAKILAIDRRCQVDLVRDHYHRYFLAILSDSSYDAHYRTMAAFVMKCIVQDYSLGQEVAYQANLIAYCLEQLDDPDPMLRKWLAICLGCSWDNYEDARWCGVRSCAHEKLYSLLDDLDPEVRAAAVYALGTFINSSSERTDHANTIDHSIGMKLVSASLYDSSVLVRHELVVALQYLVLSFESQFIKLEQAAREDERKQTDEIALGSTPPSMGSTRVHAGFLSPTIQTNRPTSKNFSRSHDANPTHHNLTPINSSNIPRVNSLNAISLAFGSGSKIVSNVYHIIWKAMYTLAADPHARISAAAQVIIDEMRSRSFSGMSSESLKESKSNSSISESSSPNTAATFSISESPPSSASAAAFNRAKSVILNNELGGGSGPGTTTSTILTTTTTNNVYSSSPSKMMNQHQQDLSSSLNRRRHQQQVLSSNNNGHDHHHPPHTTEPPMPNNNHHHHNPNGNNNDTELRQHQVNNNNNNTQQASSIDRITKSANVAINNHGGSGARSKRYAPSRDNTTSEDDNRSNLSSQRPLISTEFVDWCSRYFVDPENNYTTPRASKNSKEDQQREWRMLRVLSYRNVCLRQLMVVDPIRFNESVSNFKVSQVPNLIAVHPYDPIMIIAGRDEFSVMHLDGPHVNNYDSSGLASSISTNSILTNPTQHNSHHHHHHNSSNLSSSSVLLGGVNSHHHHHNHHHNHFSTTTLSNGQAANITDNYGGGCCGGASNDLIGTQSNYHSCSSHITSLQLINPQYNTLVCTGSSEGSVKIWRAYNGIDYSFNPQLISSFYLMPELQPSRQGLGMILLWDQHQSRFFATSDQNDVRIIKVWDAASESKIQDIPTLAEFGVSCLSSDGEHSIAAGFLDGSIRIYDTRLKKTDCRTFTFRKHSEKILTLHMFKPGEKHINLVSGDSGGEVRFWDKRTPTSVKRVDVGQKMSVMSVHPNADVFACGLKSGQGIKIYNLDGTSRAGCVIKCLDNNFFTSRHNPSVSCLAFHPLKTSLVSGFSDAVVSIYSSRTVP